MNFLIHPSFTRNILFVIFTIFVAMVASRLLQSLIRVPKRFKNKRSQTYASVVRNIITATIYILALYAIFIILGINITPLLASAGILGITLGFGARPLIEDLIAGFFLLSQQAIAIGDYVKVADAEGYIEAIGFRTLSVRDLSGALSIIPNGQIKSVINFSRHRATVPVEIAFSSQQKIASVLKELRKVVAAMQSDARLGYLVYPESRVSGVEDIKKDTIIVRVVLVTPPAFRNQVARDFRYRIKKLAESKKLKLA